MNRDSAATAVHDRSPARRRARLLGLLLAAGSLLPAPAAATKRIDPATNFDLRFQAPAELQRLAERYGAPVANLAAARDEELERAAAELAATLPGLGVTRALHTGGAEVVHRSGGPLSAPAPDLPGGEIALGFLHRHAGLYGLSPEQLDELAVRGESRSPSGLRTVRLEQRVGGVPVFQGELRVLLDRQGRVVRTVGRLVPGLFPEPAGGPLLPPEQALAAALAGVGLAIDPARVEISPRPGEGNEGRLELRCAEGEILGPVTSWPVLFPLAPGLAVPAWAQVIFTRDSGAFYTVVASDGTLLWRKSLQHDASRQEARFEVYVQSDGVTPADSPAPGSPNRLRPRRGTQFPAIGRRVADMSRVQDPEASPDGWIPDGGETTTGNNADVYLDTDGDGEPDPFLLDASGRPAGNPDPAGRNRDFLGSAPRDFRYTPPPAGGDPDAGDDPTAPAYRRGVVTQAFYTANWFHDRLYRLGFDEAAGNFQHGNFGRGGAGGDRLAIELQDEEASSNAFFQGGPDGAPARIRMFLFRDASPAREPALDAEVLIHELAHGLTTRRVGDGTGLFFTQGGALGEGWSDFYALALLNSHRTDDPDGQYATGAYSTYRLGGSLTENYLYGVRRFPYTTDNRVNPLSWGDTDQTTADTSGGIPSSPRGLERAGASEVHNAGELWALSLWEVRSRIIAAHDGQVPAGNRATLRLVTDALAATPADPTFTDARDALLDVDCATEGCAHEEQIWAGFADRGLGYGAAASTPVAFHYGVRESFAMPHLDVARVRVDDSAGNGDGYLDPGETAELTLDLFNPWRGAPRAVEAATGRLTTSTAGVEILDGEAVWGPIAPRGTTAAGDTFRIRVDPAMACGRSLDLAVETTSSLGVTTARFSLRLGTPAGPGEPRVLHRRIPGGREIPDALPTGVLDVQRVEEDLEIADLDFRIDELRHPFVGDLVVTLRGPGGYGFDPVFLPGGDCGGGPGLGCNDGDDFLRTVFDDEAGRDLVTAGAEAAPFTGRWRTFGNSPVLGELADPVPQLSRFDGTSTRGSWHVQVTDLGFEDVGRLASWSLIVRPQTRVCGALRPGTLGFSSEAFPAGEDLESVPVTVERVRGADGEVSVRYATEDLSATAGEDYQPVSGTLSWADGDREPKIFTVPLAADGAPEATELVGLTLSQPGGGAELGLATAVAPIRDDDRGAGCTGAPASLCLLDGRFEVEVAWRDPRSGAAGPGGAIPATDSTGLIWFFDPANVELIVKMLDGRPLTGAFWLFYGALSDVEYWVVATDTASGSVAVYHNRPFELCGRADTGAFPEPGTGPVTAASGSLRFAAVEAPAAGPAPASPGCAADAETLCLLGGRLAARVRWRDPRSGDEGVGRAVTHSDATGMFWFFQPHNLELVVKALDATSFAGKLWIFYGALSDVEYTLTVTDTMSGVERDFHNPPFQLCGGADTETFDAR